MLTLREDGFALIVTLGLLAVVLLSVLALTSLTRSQIDVSRSQSEILRARLAVDFGVKIALGELQQAMGADPSVSMISDANDGTRTAHWLRGFDGGTGLWLVSGGDQAGAGGTVSDWTDRLSPVPGELESRVEAGWIPADGEGGRIAWWIADEGVKASFAVPDRSRPTEGEPRVLVPEQTSDGFVFTQLQAGRPRHEVFFEEDDFDNLEITTIERVRHRQQYPLIAVNSAPNLQYHDLTPLAMGLLTRPEGGLKRNLTTGRPALASAGGFSEPSIEVLDRFLNPEGHWSWPNTFALRKGEVDPTIQTVYPARWSALSPNNRDMPLFPEIEGTLVDSILPIITEMKIYAAIFNEGRDGQHRLRYYGGFQLWNPYAFPLRIHSREYNNGLFFVNVTGTQHLEVSLYSPGSDFSEPPLRSFIVNTDPFPRIRNANTTNRIEELSYNLEIVLETSARRPPRATLQAGQVYHGESPDASDDRTGLSRLLTNRKSDEWWAEWAPGRGIEPADYGADHLIRIRSVDADGKPVAPRLNIQLKRYVGASDRNGLRPEDYPGDLVMEFRNVPFDPFELTLTGAEYYLARSSQYNRADYRFAYHFKIENEDDLPGILGLLSERVDIRNPVIDLADPDIADLFFVESDVELAVRSGTAFSDIDDGESPFWSNSLNESGRRFGSFRLFDHPTRPPVSIAALRHLSIAGSPPFAIGSENGGIWNQMFDEFYLTGTTQNGDEFLNIPGEANPQVRTWGEREPMPPLPNQRIRLDEARLAALGIERPDSAKKMADLGRDAGLAEAAWIEGSFNVNSASAKAWQAVLARSIPEWRSRLAQQGAGSASGDPERLDRVFFRHSFNGGAPLPERNPPLRDVDLAAEGNLRRRQEVLFGQGFRWLGETGGDGAIALGRLAKSLSRRIGEYQAANGPFRSLADFIDSGLISAAIRESEINKGITEGSPLYIREGDLLEAIAPFLTCRSDTFRIRVVAEVPNLSGQVIERRLEVTVMRSLDYVDPASNSPDAEPDALNPINARLGRAFRILDYRWIP